MAGIGETVLVIEERTELDHRIIEAEDGPAGLAILQSPRRIDLLITDIGLPGLNGWQMAEAASLLRAYLKILFMSGYAEHALMPSGFLKPGMDLVTKTFAMDALAARIRAMIEASTASPIP